MKSLVISLLIMMSVAPLLPVAAGESGAATLQRFVGARSAGMGDAFSTVSDDISAGQFNPAMLGTLSQPQGLAYVSRGFASDCLSSLAVGFPTRFGNFLAGINYYDTGSEKLYASDGSVINVHLQRDLLGTISYGKKIGVISMGASAKYLSSELAEYKTASGYAFDIGGALIFDSPNVSFGLSLRNVGQGLKFISERDPLPRELRMGGSYAFQLRNDNSKMLLSADIPYMIVDKKTVANLGAEWLINNGFSVRVGQHFNSDIQSFTFGFGLKIKTMVFDYSFGAAGPLDNIHNVSLGYRL
ncbi:MAG: PorV/PorQ family protein [Candidatus Omnitrophica bacterium]|nr:PorV/PorQ family protein [Candidatus Omnitrophota bacterium]MCG2710996.1 PorV/PorQ family protein [Candidatus Omnitrophota bacterium]